MRIASRPFSCRVLRRCRLPIGHSPPPHADSRCEAKCRATRLPDTCTKKWLQVQRGLRLLAQALLPPQGSVWLPECFPREAISFWAFSPVWTTFRSPDAPQRPAEAEDRNRPQPIRSEGLPPRQARVPYRAAAAGSPRRTAAPFVQNVRAFSAAGIPRIPTVSVKYFISTTAHLEPSARRT